MQGAQQRRTLMLSAAMAAAVGGLVELSPAADVSWDAGGSSGSLNRSWGIAGNWSGDVIPTASDTVIFGPGVDIAGAISLSGVTGGSSMRVADVVRFTATEHVYTLNGGALQVNRIEDLGYVAAVSGGHAINVPVTTTGSNLTLRAEHLPGAMPLNLAGIGVSGGPAQSFGVIKDGGGIVHVRGHSVYSGQTVVREGTLEFRGASGGATGSAGFSIAAGATLSLNSIVGNRSDRIGDGAGISLDGATLSQSGAANATTTERVGVINFAGGANTVNVAYGGTTGAAALTASHFVRNNRATVAIEGLNLGGVGTSAVSTFKLDAAPAMIGSSNTPGTTNQAVVPWITSGRYLVTYDYGAPGSGPADDIGFRPLQAHELETSFTGSTFNPNVRIVDGQVVSGFTTVNSLTMDGGAITGSGSLSVHSSAIVTHGGTIENTGGITGGGGHDMIVHALSGTTTINASLNSMHYGLTKTGPGELVLGGANSASAATVLNQGTLTLANPAALSTTAIQVSTGGNASPRLNFRRMISETQRTLHNNIDLRGNGQLSLGGDFGTPLSLLGSVNAIHLTGVISGDASLLVDGGAVALRGNNTYTGGTRLNTDTHLLLGHDNALGSGPLTIAPGNTGVIRVISPTGPAPSMRTIANDVFAEGSMHANAAGGGLTLTGDVSAVDREIITSNVGAPASLGLTLAGTLTSPTPGPWVVNGGGVLRLRTTTPLADDFTVRSGTLEVGNDALTGDVTLGVHNTGALSMWLLLNPALNGGANYSYDGDMTVAGGDTGRVAIGGRHSAGTTTFNGTLTLGSAPDGTFLGHSVNLSSSPGGTVVFAGEIRDADSSISSSVHASGGGTVRFTGPTYTYKGMTEAVGGTDLHIEPAATLASTSYRANGSGSMIQLAGNVPAESVVEAVGAGTINLVGSRQVAAITAGNQGTISAAAGGVSTVATTGLTINDTGKLQLNDNDLIVDYTGDSIASAIRDLVIRGRDTGFGITTLATGDGDTVLAIVDNLEWGKTSYNGFDIDDTTIIGKYTYYGDANLDGKVTGDDYVAIDSNLGTGDSWIEGDFNMDGIVSGDDYVAIDSNLGSGTADPLAFAELKAEMVALHVEMFGEGYLTALAAYEVETSAVPEASSVAGVLGMACMLLTRRRRSVTCRRSR